MTWFETLEKRKQSISPTSKKLIDTIMLNITEPKSVKEVKDLIYNEIEKKRKDNKQDRRVTSNYGRSFPTTNELRYYLQKNYHKGKDNKYMGAKK